MHRGDMDQIEPDALYDERADVSRARPLLQGDVFDDVILPGFPAVPVKVQIVAHPANRREPDAADHRRPSRDLSTGNR